jgi:hypothetical protein
MDDYVQAWQCIGCGRIEAPQPCIGVCRDRKVFMVGKATHDQALADSSRLRRALEVTRAKLARFALCTPRDGSHAQTFDALKTQIRELLVMLEREGVEAEARNLSRRTA